MNSGLRFLLLLLLGVIASPLTAQRSVRGLLLGPGKQGVCCATVVFRDTAGRVTSVAPTTADGVYFGELSDGAWSGSLRVDDLRFQAIDTVIHVSPATDTFPTLRLLADTATLNEVVVRGERPYVVNGDTTSFSVAAYQRTRDRNVQDLLARLPGVEVSPAGSISVNGKKVSKVMVEGDDLFGGRYQTLTQTAPVKIINRVEVIENFNDKPIGAREVNEEVALNLRLAADARSRLFGVADVLMSERVIERYDAKLTAMNFGQQRKYLATARANDIGESIRYSSGGIGLQQSLLENAAIAERLPVKFGQGWSPIYGQVDSRELGGEISMIQRLGEFTKATLHLAGVDGRAALARNSSYQYFFVDSTASINLLQQADLQPRRGGVNLALDYYRPLQLDLSSNTSYTVGHGNHQLRAVVNQQASSAEAISERYHTLRQDITFRTALPDSAKIELRLTGERMSPRQTYQLGRSPLRVPQPAFAFDTLNQLSLGTRDEISTYTRYGRKFGNHGLSIINQLSTISETNKLGGILVSPDIAPGDTSSYGMKLRQRAADTHVRYRYGKGPLRLEGRLGATMVARRSNQPARAAALTVVQPTALFGLWYKNQNGTKFSLIYSRDYIKPTIHELTVRNVAIGSTSVFSGALLGVLYPMEGIAASWSIGRLTDARTFRVTAHVQRSSPFVSVNQSVVGQFDKITLAELKGQQSAGLSTTLTHYLSSISSTLRFTASANYSDFPFAIENRVIDENELLTLQPDISIRNLSFPGLEVFLGARGIWSTTRTGQARRSLLNSCQINYDIYLDVLDAFAINIKGNTIWVTPGNAGHRLDLVDLRAQYSFPRGTDVSFGLHNVFNEKHENRIRVNELYTLRQQTLIIPRYAYLACHFAF